MMLSLILSASLVIRNPIIVDAALLAGLPISEVTLSAHGSTRRCEGPRLRDLVAKLGVPTGHDLTRPMPTRGVVVRARDGYAVLFSLGELDAALGASGAIVAVQCDGKPLDNANGPFCLVMSGDQRAARSVRQVASIELVDAAVSK